MNEATLKMLGQLGEIIKSVEGLKTCLQRPEADNYLVHERLTHIWQVTQELERSLTTPEMLAAQRSDAVLQVEKAFQLVSETKAFEMDDQQLTSIGFSFEIAAESIKKYLSSARRDTRNKVAEAVMEG